jgi:hypothetical protein
MLWGLTITGTGLKKWSPDHRLWFERERIEHFPERTNNPPRAALSQRRRSRLALWYSRSCNFGDRDGRCIGGQNGVGPRLGCQFREYALLDFEVLRGSLERAFRKWTENGKSVWLRTSMTISTSRSARTPTA